MNLGPGQEGFRIQNRPPELSGAPLEVGSEQKQRRLMLVALALLLVALIVVLIKDRQFWFPSNQTAESDVVDENPSSTASQAQPASGAPTAPGSTRTKAKQRPATPVAATTAPPTPVVTTNRAVLPPLEVEVVAGGQRQTIPPTTNNSIKVELQPRSSAPASGAGVTSATERVQLSPDAAQVLVHPVQPNYPLLAKQMKVQGAVVLQALIGKEGTIQDLHVVSGPAILSSAAREAVKQWRFKPYYQAGQAVETEARITVTFTISTY
jgi:TonB family protein